MSADIEIRNHSGAMLTVKANAGPSDSWRLSLHGRIPPHEVNAGMHMSRGDLEVLCRALRELLDE